MTVYGFAAKGGFYQPSQCFIVELDFPRPGPALSHEVFTLYREHCDDSKGYELRRGSLNA